MNQSNEKQEVRKTFYDRDYIPKTLEELYCSGWKEYMLFHIRKYNLNDINHSPEDLLQDMMVQMATNSFLDKFDPEVSEFTVYLFTFIRNFMSKPYNKEHKTKHGSKIVNHVAIVESASEVESGASDSVISQDVLAGDRGGFVDALCMAQSLEQDLAEIKTDSWVEYNGEMIRRDPLTVYRFLSAGYEIKEIAEIFGTSKQLVYSLRNKIAAVIATY